MRVKLGLTLLISLLLSMVYGFAEPTNYTATMVDMGKESPYARDGNKVRMEMNMGQPGMGKMISIIRMDLNRIYMLNPGKKTYFENDWQPEKNRQRMPSVYDINPDYKIDKIKVGATTIDKHPCIKYTVTIINLKTQDKYTGTSWEATDLQNLPIRYESIMDNGTRYVMNLKNIKLNAATSDMFETPAEYTKVDSMPELMGISDMDMPGKKTSDSVK
jgi:hypothetical protein